MYQMVCTCPTSTDMRAINLRDEADLEGERWWVHSVCGKPNEAWLRSLGDVMLNFFQGGDQDGRAYATSTLLDHQYLMEGYRWSDEVITSEKSGATARVWVYEAQALAISSQDQNGQEERSMSQIEERRKTIGASRGIVADQAGLTVAVLSRIERGGPRTTAAEIKTVNDALDSIEAGRVQSTANPT